MGLEDEPPSSLENYLYGLRYKVNVSQLFVVESNKCILELILPNPFGHDLVNYKYSFEPLQYFYKRICLRLHRIATYFLTFKVKHDELQIKCTF